MEDCKEQHLLIGQQFTKDRLFEEDRHGLETILSCWKQFVRNLNPLSNIEYYGIRKKRGQQPLWLMHQGGSWMQQGAEFFFCSNSRQN